MSLTTTQTAGVPRLLTSYHVHTRWSDGSSEMAEYIQCAADAGLDEIGFADHYALLPEGGTTSWSTARDGLGDYLEAIRDAASRAPDHITVRSGLEVDFIPASLADLRQALQPHRFDYLIGSVHIVNEFIVDGSSPGLHELSVAESDQIVKDYWTLVREMAESRLFDIAGHLDVIDKGSPAFTPSFDVFPLVRQALDSIKAAGMAVEMNTSGWYTACGHAFPAEPILQECSNLDIPVIVTADAHRPIHVSRGFPRAQELLRRVGCASTCSFKNGRAVSPV